MTLTPHVLKRSKPELQYNTIQPIFDITLLLSYMPSSEVHFHASAAQMQLQCGALWMRHLLKVPTWWSERDSNLRPSGWNLPSPTTELPCLYTIRACVYLNFYEAFFKYASKAEEPPQFLEAVVAKSKS